MDKKEIEWEEEFTKIWLSSGKAVYPFYEDDGAYIRIKNFISYLLSQSHKKWYKKGQEDEAIKWSKDMEKTVAEEKERWREEVLRQLENIGDKTFSGNYLECKCCGSKEHRQKESGIKVKELWVYDDIISLINKEMKQPKMYCPECNAEYDDFDGFGILYCEKCGYCSHASVTGDICQFCKKNIKKEQ